MDYAEDVTRMGTVFPDLARELEGFTSIEHVLRWMQAREASLDSLDVVTQDEFSHDAVVPLGADGRHLTFGMT